MLQFEGSPTSDPAWDSLQKQQEKVIQYLTKSKMGNLNKDDVHRYFDNGKDSIKIIINLAFFFLNRMIFHNKHS